MSVTKFPTKNKESLAKKFTIADRGWSASVCAHTSIAVDESLMEVSCRLCNEKLNPTWVLLQQAKRENALHESLIKLSTHLEAIKEKTKTKCFYCKKMTPIKRNISALESYKIEEKIREEFKQ